MGVRLAPAAPRILHIEECEEMCPIFPKACSFSFEVFKLYFSISKATGSYLLYNST